VTLKGESVEKFRDVQTEPISGKKPEGIPLGLIVPNTTIFS
jgi:hypothetical protein